MQKRSGKLWWRNKDSASGLQIAEINLIYDKQVYKIESERVNEQMWNPLKYGNCSFTHEFDIHMHESRLHWISTLIGNTNMNNVSGRCWSTMSETHDHRWITEYDPELKRLIDKCVICGVKRIHNLHDQYYNVHNNVSGTREWTAAKKWSYYHSIRKLLHR